MDLTRLLEVTLSPDNHSIRCRFDETTCGSLCQHPSCWASQRRQEKGVPRLLPSMDDDSDSSSDELNLPKQSVCNLLEDYGDSPTDRYPLSTGGRPSHMWESTLLPIHRTSISLENSKPKRSKAGPIRNSRLRLVEVQEVFDRDDLNSQWDETFVTKPYYMWVPNPKKRRRRQMRAPPNTVSDGSQPVLFKDLTDCVVPPEIEHQREETILFDEWPVLKKKQQRTRSPPSRPMQHVQILADSVSQSDISIDTEGSSSNKRQQKHIPICSINELLALPKETLMKVLESTKKSDFTSKGRLHQIVQESTRNDEKAQMALSARELFKQKRMRLHQEPRWGSPNPPAPKPVYQMDDDEVIDRLSLVNTPVKEKDRYSEADSVETFPRFKKPLPGIQGPQKSRRAGPHVPAVQRPKIPSISLGLPELPSGIRTTRPFSYKRQDLDFSLGPVLSGTSSVRSSISGDYSDHGTTVKVNAPSSATGQYEDLAIHSVSPALSTNVPMAPAGTPATFQSPTKSAPFVREITKDTAQLTVNTSEKAHPPSRETRDETFLSSPAPNIQHAKPLSPMDTKVSMAADEVLDTINETARENQGSSVQSSRVGAGEFALVTPTQPVVEEVQEKGSKVGRPTLKLETSHHNNIDTASSPRARSAKSVESCPSPEQWPLISESSFEKMGARPTVSEPTLSGRSDRRRPISRGRDPNSGQGTDRDYARKVMDEKRKAESPAPPPPSPEPKDPSEKAEHRMRKELKSRDSLTMAPLFEVSELEESSPTKGFNKDDFDRPKGRSETTRTIQVTVPVAKTDPEDEKKPDAEEEVIAEETKDNGELVSQITVLNVTPKGRTAGEGPKDKVQETFLNVDIPAEDISSIKAEHGSTHQEELSSNSTYGKSHASTTGSESSFTPRGHGSQVKDDTTDGDVSNKLPVVSEDDSKQVPDESKLPDSEVGDPQHTYRDPLNEELENQKVSASETSSNVSPEMLCDSARFISHEMVSPDEDEMQGESTFVGGGMGDDTVKEKDEMPKTTEQDQTGDQSTEESGEQKVSSETGVPGSFFFISTPLEDGRKAAGQENEGITKENLEARSLGEGEETQNEAKSENGTGEQVLNEASESEAPVEASQDVKAGEEKVEVEKSDADVDPTNEMDKGESEQEQITETVKEDDQKADQTQTNDDDKDSKEEDTAGETLGEQQIEEQQQSQGSTATDEENLKTTEIAEAEGGIKEKAEEQTLAENKAEEKDTEEQKNESQHQENVDVRENNEEELPEKPEPDGA